VVNQICYIDSCGSSHHGNLLQEQGPNTFSYCHVCPLFHTGSPAERFCLHKSVN
jgi:hypothetical protein